MLRYNFASRTFTTRLMNAMVVNPNNSFDFIKSSVPIPEIDPDKECLVKVKATAVNRADIL